MFNNIDPRPSQRQKINSASQSCSTPKTWTSPG